MSFNGELFLLMVHLNINNAVFSLRMKKNENEIKKIKKPWPTKKVMKQVYEMNLWGTHNAEFYSGDGSHLPEIVLPYLTAVSSFLMGFKKPITVCDLGCGDFNIGKELVKHTHQYFAVDIVPELIAHLQLTCKEEKLKFLCLDISTDDLPTGECVILRQVLQHLSNIEVHHILNKLKDFKFIILTEHLPNGSFSPNKNILSGQGIRIKKQSGIKIIAPPFNFQVKEEKQLLSYTLSENKGVIVTTLYTVF